MAKYELLVDGRARWKASDEDDLRTWLQEYREEHTADDPEAAHVQIRRLSALSGAGERGADTRSCPRRIGCAEVASGSGSGALAPAALSSGPGAAPAVTARVSIPKAIGPDAWWIQNRIRPSSLDTRSAAAALVMVGSW